MKVFLSLSDTVVHDLYDLFDPRLVYEMELTPTCSALSPELVAK